MLKDRLIRSLFNESGSTLIAEQLRSTPATPLIASDFHLNDIQRDFIVDKNLSFYSVLVDATPVLAGTFKCQMMLSFH